jgi:hypothetical protein
LFIDRMSKIVFGRGRRTVTGERILDALQERHYTSEPLFGRVRNVFRSPYGDDLVVELDGLDGEAHVVLVSGPGCQTIRRFLLGKIVRLLCRPMMIDALFARHGFTALVSVEGLSTAEDRELWPWRIAALGILRDVRRELTPFEVDLCETLAVWGLPPSHAQRRAFRAIVAKPSGHPTLESTVRAERFDADRRTIDPVHVGLVAAQFCDTWLHDR